MANLCRSPSQKGQRLAAGSTALELLGLSMRLSGGENQGSRFLKSGQCLERNAQDDLCIVRSLHTDAIDHDPAHTFMNTGTMIAGRPAMDPGCCMDSGSESESLPGFVVMVSTGKYGQRQPIAARQWHSGFLPGQFQGVEFRGTGDPVLYVGNPKGVNSKQQRDVVDAVQRLNGLANNRLDDPEIATRISQYELAFRMQSSVPELMDVGEKRLTSLTCTARRAEMAHLRLTAC